MRGRRRRRPQTTTRPPCPDSRLGAAQPCAGSPRQRQAPNRPVRADVGHPAAAAPIKRSGPLPSVPVRPGQAPIADGPRGKRTARPLSTPALAAQAKRRHPWVSPCWRRNHHGRTRPTVASALSQPARPSIRWSRRPVAKPVAPAATAAPPRAFLPSLSVSLRRTHPCAVGVRSSDQDHSPTPAQARGSLRSGCCASFPCGRRSAGRQAHLRRPNCLPPNLPSQPLRRRPAQLRGRAPRNRLRRRRFLRFTEP